MSQVLSRPRSTEPFLAKVAYNAEDICDNVVTEGYTTRSTTMLMASPETLHKKITSDAPRIVPAGGWVSQNRLWCSRRAQGASTSLWIGTKKSFWGYTMNLHETGGPLVITSLDR